MGLLWMLGWKREEDVSRMMRRKRRKMRAVMGAAKDVVKAAETR
jgi:hypothetical protein